MLGAKYASEGVDIDKQTLQEMWDIRSQDFARCGVSENNIVYKICEDSYRASQEGIALVNDEASHHALRKLAGVGLYLSQQKTREGSVKYDNAREFLELAEASRTLKGVHPDLFEKYGFETNLQLLQGLLPENALSDRIDKAMQEMFPKETQEKVVLEKESIKERE